MLLRFKDLLLLLSAIAMSWLVPASVCAQQSDTGKFVSPRDTTLVNRLQEVSVATRISNEKNVSATSVQIISGKQLERINSLSVADAVRFFSGVQLKDYGGIGGLKTINVRSMGINHTAVFYDGVQLGNAQNGQVDLGKFSLENIDEIALYNGQRSTIFQPAKGFASGSSLYLSAKQPSFEQGKKSTEKATIKSGSFGLLDPSVLWQYKISNRTYSSINAEWIHADGRYKFRYTNGVYDTIAKRSNGDINAYRAELGVNGTFRDSSTWNTKLYLYSSERGLAGAIVSNHFDYTQRQWDRNIFIQSSCKKEITGNYSLLLNARYANDYTRYLDPDYITTTGFLDNRYHQQEWYVSVANRYRFTSFWSAALSADYQWNKLDANLYHFSYPVRNTLLTALATELHFARLIIQANVLGTFVNDRVQQYASAGSKTEYTPSLLFSWQPFADKGLRLRGFYKKIFRLPTFNDLYYTFTGNTFLKPENTWQYDIGITYTKAFTHGMLNNISVQTDAYYNYVKDKIVAIPGANLFRWTMYNLGKVSIKGLEINTQQSWQIANTIHLNTGLSYTYQQALDVTGADNYKSQIPYTPRNSGSLLAGAEWRAVSLNYSFIYTGERYSQKANIPVNYLQPWYTHDLSLGYLFTVHKSTVKLTAEVNNLLNQYYDVIANFPMPGRSYRFTLSIKR